MSHKNRFPFKTVLANFTGQGVSSPGDGFEIKTPRDGYRIGITKVIIALASDREVKLYFGGDDPDAAGNLTSFHHGQLSSFGTFIFRPGTEDYPDEGTINQPCYLAVSAGTGHYAIVWGYEEEG